MFTRVDWSTVLLRRRNSFNPPVLTKFAPPNRALVHRKKRTVSFETDGLNWAGSLTSDLGARPRWGLRILRLPDV